MSEETDSSARPREVAIRDAAEALMLEGGLSALSASAVAARAGVNKALIFYYFDSVAELVSAVLSRYYERHREALEHAFDSEGTVRERLLTFADRYFDWMTENRAYARIVQEHVARRGEHAAVVSDHTRELLRVCREELTGVLPADGPLSIPHFYLTIAASVINYFTYAPLLEVEWGRDPLSDEALEERRAHLRWMVEAFLDKLGV